MSLQGSFDFLDNEVFEEEKRDVKETYETEALVTEGEIAEELGENYRAAAALSSNSLLMSATEVNTARESSFSAAFTGGNIWQRLRRYLCKVLNAASAAEDIIDAILNFLIGVIPGGMVLKGIVRKILKYFINRGYEALCPVV
ncbi:hypothetical protein ACLI08_01880 [Flavobacterium sp. RNTU_13]|uniref:hypothetical protein n=1 Tax=Flavobacterium sp. RNTU_13 TaxID=3375145 RepID=UPI0039871596